MNKFKHLALFLVFFSTHILAIDGTTGGHVSPEEMAILCRILGKCGPEQLNALIPEIKSLGKRTGVDFERVLPDSKKSKEEEPVALEIDFTDLPRPVVLPKDIANTCPPAASPGSESPKPETSAPEASKPSPTFGLSPGSALVKRAIYRHYVKVEGAYYPPEDRFDIRTMVPKGKRLNKDNLYDVLLQIELSVLKKLKEQPGLMHTTVYVGQAKEIDDRYVSHRRDIMVNPKDKVTHKGTVERQILNLDQESIDMSYVAKGIPTKFLGVFECLFAELFNVLGRGGASAVIGTEQDWIALRAYQSWQKRLDVLDNAGFTNLLNEIISLGCVKWAELAKIKWPE